MRVGLSTLRNGVAFLCARFSTGTFSPSAEYQPIAGKFELRQPAPQNALDLFRGRWASDLSEVLPGVTSGTAGHFRSDPRPGYLLKRFGGPDGTLADVSILDIGPLEGGHAYLLEQLGAGRIIAVEANSEAFLKCLIAKNALAMRTEFLLGDILEYLRYVHLHFGIIFCSGVLYHMEDPFELIHLMTQRTSRIFLWTHYYTPQSHSHLSAMPVIRNGEMFEYFPRQNLDRNQGRFWGGNRPAASLLRRQDILRAFAMFGFTEHEVHDEQVDHPNGPCFSLSLWRPAGG